MILSETPVDYFKVFLGGIGLSFTPCVFPLIPVIIGYITGKANTTRPKGFILSFVYVSGIAVTYSILGLFASLTGQIFGKISAHPISYIFAGLVIIIFGLSMFDLFVMSFPCLFKAPVLKKGNYFSVFLLGLSSGLVISPCVTPALGAILLYLAAKKNILYGTALLFSFAYGMGSVLILSGTFSSILVNFPKSGRWMIYIKRIWAVILICIGSYFIFTAIRRL